MSHPKILVLSTSDMNADDGVGGYKSSGMLEAIVADGGFEVFVLTARSDVDRPHDEHWRRVIPNDHVFRPVGRGSQGADDPHMMAVAMDCARRVGVSIDPALVSWTDVERVIKAAFPLPEKYREIARLRRRAVGW